MSEKALNFSKKLKRDRTEAFVEFLEVSYCVNPLLDDEMRRLTSEYVTLHKNAVIILGTQKQDKIELKPENIWYTLLTDESYYRNCKVINYFCFEGSSTFR